MAMLQYNIPVSMLRQYCFCPRIPYFYIVRSIKPYEQPWVKQGTDEHIRQQMLMKRRNLSRFNINKVGIIKNNIELYSEKLNLHGICDAVIECPERSFVLEFKNSSFCRLSTGTSVQLAAYAMLYEENFKNHVETGFVLYGTKAKTFEIKIDQKLREKTLGIRDKIIEITQYSNIPSSPADETQCGQCEFFNFCADRF